MLKRFLGDRKGNFAVMFALTAVPITFALGGAADYGFAVQTRSHMNAAADAAALAAVTPQMMAQSTTVAKLAATQMFNAQVSALPRLVYDPTTLNVTVNEPTPVGGKRIRTVVVSYTAASQTAFAKILHMSTIAISGSSTASASTSPNIDFYLMLDTSPSMAIPATTDGIAWMVAHTPSQGNGTGCAFACHEKYPNKENPSLGNPGGEDNYALARSANPPIVLRMDLVAQAVSNLIDTAQATATQNGAAYRLAGYTFDVAVNLPMPLQVPTASSKTQAANIQMLQVDYENVLNGSGNSDQDTNFDVAFPRLYSDMTTAGAGTGTNTTGDKPQQVLMIVTDGVSDEPWNNQRTYLPLGGTTSIQTDANDWCNKIKATPNTRIAVLYLVYNPLPMKDGGQPSWYALNVASLQNDIAPVLQTCASSGLFYQVNTGGDVSAAMQNLFNKAVATARLTN